jgi:hypothetical protein
VRLRYPRSVRRRYDLLTRFPVGFLVTGDALCSLSPLYGQGMSVAAMEAVLLRRLLAHGPGQLAGRFFTAAAALLSMPWAMTCRTGQPREGQPCYSQDLGEYLSRFYTAAAGDPVLAGALLRVASLSEPPSALLTTENQNRVRDRDPNPVRAGRPARTG